ncbi:MAG: DUF2163 domain-containing protein [Bdellovibrionales bacterium]
MKSIPTNLAAHIAGELTTLAWLLKIDRADGATLAFTTHDNDIAVDGVTYDAADSFSLSALDTPVGLAPANAEALGLLHSDAVDAADIAAGHYDGAAVTIALCNWQAPEDGVILLRKGTVGTISFHGGQYRFEIKGLMDTLAQTIGDTYTKTCRHRLGNAACGIDTASGTWRKTGTLTSAASTTQVTDSARTEADGFFDYGTLAFTSGPNSGLSFDIRSFSSGTFTLWQELPFTAAAGHAYVAVAGCDKLHATCQNKFSNALNFGGFPHIPGADALLQTPDAKIE